MPAKDQGPLRLLQMSAYAVIVAAGIRFASGLLSLVLISLLLAYAILPFPNWLMRRYGMSKSSAILWTLVSVVALYLFVSVALIEAGFGMHAKLPIYEEHIQALYQKVIVFLGAHGIQSAALTSKSLYDSSRILSFVEMILPKLLGFVSDRVIVSVLSLIFLIEIAEIEDGAKSPLARTLLYYGQDVQRFIAISAQTGAITAVANLALLIALRVDFPIMWCVLYFFLHFIPNIGFLISLVPPVVLALLTFGWKRALFVAIGLIVTQMISDYALQPVLMKKGLHISFLETLLSLLVWGFLLGPAGAVLGVPLTIALRKYIQDPLTKPQVGAVEPAPG